ncbi:uncharacterized protein LAESUDRAFT_689788 [Laetiporus sulphureus 93-53]|uniref:C2H2-type domain-containing protein n=1 Tax=Laetiporus sulphureus 93-53 TaxID=1314785 RepID=A0A165IC05_9APHY|nr:uncharacterized protein LAESUDRAFT_689788 [Laetiporus sulphureus 93-53]KZT12870.1 hypothetical protein LAESUDRAFT_689788 [Laetiporus sulphureus 93-53]
MSSWSGAAYPPPPRGRSRSRSPYRGTYPPRPMYPEPGYPDPYRGDWDVYDRERAWANYERERAAYEYSRRGRSRSPPLDEASRKRRRSLSPWERERFEPRPRYGDDYDAHSRGYGYGSPHRGQYPPPPPYGSLRRAPPDPHTFDYPASLKQYAEWFRFYHPQQAIEEDNADKAAEQEAGDGSKPRNGIRTRWEKYKKEFSAQQLQRMYDHHRKSPWFAEKYDPAPEFAAMRARVRKTGWRGRMDNFLLDLEAGKFDPDLSEREPEAASPTKEVPPSSEPTANGTEASAGRSSPEESKQNGAGGNAEDDMQFNVEAEDEGGDNDASRTDANGKTFADNRRNNRGEEIAVQPEGNQVMIRTIPPDIGRAKLEEACGQIPGFVYLALGDPLQKRNYYRAGWLKFTDDADMSTVMAELSDKKIEGFKLHVAHNTKPFTSRVRYAPEVASKPDRIAKDLANARKLASLLEEEYETLRKMKIPPKQETNGDASVNGEAEQPDVGMGEAAVSEDEESEPRERGSEAVERRIEKIMADLKEHGQVDTADEKALEAKKAVVSLDLYLAYLRAAFHTCYYCAVVTDHLEELQRKCVKHVRKPMSKALLQEVKAAEEKAEQEQRAQAEGDDEKKEKEVAIKEKTESRDWKRNDERWLEWLDSKIALLIDRNGVDPRDYGGKSYEEELSKAAEPHMKQEDEGKFRCKTCQKLFKATSFVEKHIANKHPELVKHLEEIPYFNNFALDPHRIQPFAHPPAPVGNSQAPPPQAYGLQGPAYPPTGEYGRGSAPYSGSYGGYPPPYANGGFWDPYGYPYLPNAYPQPPPPRRDEGVGARRLSERISGFAPGYEQNVEVPPVPASAGLPAKPMATLEPGPGGRRSGRTSAGGPPPPPPPDAKEDPRAAAGRKISYHDMDLVAEGDVELQY